MDITEICADVRNYFAPVDKKADKSFIHKGEFTISGKSVTPLDFIEEGQFFRIVGSAKNDGVYLNTVAGRQELEDETFTGAIWEMCVPRAFLQLCGEIILWRAAYESAESAAMSPYSSESFAGYSYTKGGSTGTQNGSTGVSWQTQFAKRLNAWRRLNVL